MHYAFWDSDEPKSEPNCLPTLRALLSDIELQKNLVISGEYLSGTGKLDALVHGTLKDHTRATVCVEFSA
jgi:hypothetical protein